MVQMVDVYAIYNICYMLYMMNIDMDIPAYISADLCTYKPTQVHISKHAILFSKIVPKYMEMFSTTVKLGHCWNGRPSRVEVHGPIGVTMVTIIQSFRVQWLWF